MYSWRRKLIHRHMCYNNQKVGKVWFEVLNSRFAIFFNWVRLLWIWWTSISYTLHFTCLYPRSKYFWVAHLFDIINHVTHIIIVRSVPSATTYYLDLWYTYLFNRLHTIFFTCSCVGFMRFSIEKKFEAKCFIGR